MTCLWLLTHSTVVHGDSNVTIACLIHPGYCESVEGLWPISDALDCSTSQLALRICLYTTPVVPVTDVLIGGSDCYAPIQLLRIQINTGEYPAVVNVTRHSLIQARVHCGCFEKKAGNSPPFSEAVDSFTLADMGTWNSFAMLTSYRVLVYFLWRKIARATRGCRTSIFRLHSFRATH